MPRINIIAGPNGAGKTTFARSFLTSGTQLSQFVNADLIAADISPFDPSSAEVAAGKAMLAKLDDFKGAKQDFSLETTLSGTWLRSRIMDWQDSGFTVNLYFLSLSSADLAIERVRNRVAKGGHTIPDDVVRRRFDRSLKLLDSTYKNLANDLFVFDNDHATAKFADSGMTNRQGPEHLSDGEDALRAMNQGLREAFLSGQAYDPDGTGKAYWETHDESGQLIS